MKSVHFVIPVKMRRKFKLVIFLSISWMFGMIYYFQSSNSTKVSLFAIFSFGSLHIFSFTFILREFQRYDLIV